MTTKTPPPPIPDDLLERAAGCLRVLAHHHRLRIVELLQGGARPVGELSRALGIAPNACSQHLKLMEAHGMLAHERKGRSVLYRVDDPSAFGVLECIRKKCDPKARA